MESLEQLKKVLLDSVDEVITSNLSVSAQKIDEELSLTQLGVVLGSSSISGVIVGDLILALTKEGVCKIFSKMFGREIAELSAEAMEIIRKLTSLIVDNMKTKMKNEAHDFQGSSPIIISGQELNLWEVDGVKMIKQKLNADGIQFHVVLLIRQVNLPEELSLQQQETSPKLAQQENKENLGIPAPQTNEQKQESNLNQQIPQLSDDPLARLDEVLKKYREQIAKNVH